MSRSRLPGMGRSVDWGDEELATRVHQASAKLSIVGRGGPLAGRVYGSDGQPFTIGRGDGCGVLLPLAEISRKHGRVRYQAGRFWIEDLQTLNGTWLNSQLLDRPAPLRDGDRIR